MNDFETSKIEMDYVDSIMLTDDKGNIVYSVRFNPRFNYICTEKEFSQILGKNFMEVYSNIPPESSSILNCINTGKVIYKSQQTMVDFQGEVLCKQNITMPIMRSGKVIGTIELSKDITSIHDINSQIKTINKFVPKNNIKPRYQPTYYTFDSIITQDNKMKETIERAKLMSQSNSPVLVYGETGTGKELFVQAIHNASSYSTGPFIAQNLASIPENLFESLLFGSSKGAFTGAIDKIGLFEAANNGTLFLDEINSMPFHLQSKLLRVLQDQNVRKVGDTKDIHVNVHIIAAMNITPQLCLENEVLRKDLFFRLNVNSIEIPPLRNRIGDIPLLVNYFINSYNSSLSTSISGISDEVRHLFDSYSWPGNVRELQHVIEASINLAKTGVLELKYLPAYLNNADNKNEFIPNNSFDNLYSGAFYDSTSNLHDILNSIERDIIIKKYNEHSKNVSKTAKILGIPRQTLQYKLSKYNLD